MDFHADNLPAEHGPWIIACGEVLLEPDREFTSLTIPQAMVRQGYALAKDHK
jgi:hypothetical protein